MASLTRREAITISALAALAAFLPASAAGTTAQQAQSTRRHGLSTFGDLKYQPDFQNFDYVNPEAPKGGRLSRTGTSSVNTFNSLNPYIVRGDAAQGMGLTFDSLMVRAQDEPDAMYGLVAEAVEIAPDRLSATFYLRPEARFSDGSPLTAEDVAFTLETLKTKGSPAYRIALRDVKEVKVTSPREVTYTFEGDNIRDLPSRVAALPVLSKSFYATRTFEQTTLEPPLGSGPYNVGPLKQGAFITYQRRPDYWAEDLAVNRGRYNFDEIRFEYFRDRTAELEALKARAFLLRQEFTARDWATQYDISAVRNGQMKREELPDRNPSGAQGFFINMRKEKFRDSRVRQALNYAFDFEWMNKNLFYNSYTRTNSVFENSPLKAEGDPSPEERALLEPLRASLPEEVFGTAYVSPVSNGSGQDRTLLREAGRLLDEAGWAIKDGRRINAAGEPLTIEFLMFEPSFERVVAPYIKNLRLIGIEARMRMVDSAQYQERLKSFDFELTSQRFVLGVTPGPELQALFGSAAADQVGSYNLAGISNPAVDALIDRIIQAKSRDELTTAARALDRVLRGEHFWVPHWYSSKHRLAYWDVFGRPATIADYDLGIEDTWWYEQEKAAKLGFR